MKPHRPPFVKPEFTARCLLAMRPKSSTTRGHAQVREVGRALCEHAFVAAQGSAYTRLRRALDHGNVGEAFSSAAELAHVGLVEALELCLLTLDREPQRFGRAALRWHGRYCHEHRDVDLAEGQVILAALAALPGPRGKTAAVALADLLDRRGLERAGEALVAWARRAQGIPS